MWSVRRVADTGSTNADVAEAARAGAAEGLVVVADHQSAGRGRLDRSWDAPPGTALAASFLLRPDDVPLSRWPWLPLLAGVACVEAVERAAGVPAVLKWPNDVLAGGNKLAGVLVERVEGPAGPAAVVGVGLNVLQNATQLPPGAVSLAMLVEPVPDEVAGADPGVVSQNVVLDALAERLAAHYRAWRAAGGDPGVGLGQAYLRCCDTVGREVRAELPGGSLVQGRAVDVDDSGRLVLHTAEGLSVVGAGDVVHVRPA